MIELKNGVPPPNGTTKLWYSAPAAVENRLLPSLPTITPFLAKLVDPVPPKETASLPVLMISAEILGISAATKLVPVVTRPLVSTVTLV